MHLYVSFLNRFGGENRYEGPKGPLFSETATYIIYLMPDLESAHFFDLEKLGLLLVISRLGYGIQTVNVSSRYVLAAFSYTVGIFLLLPPMLDSTYVQP